MGRRRTTPELQKLKIMDGSPELTNTKGASSKKRNTIEQHEKGNINRNSSRIVTRARGKCQPTSRVGLTDDDDDVIAEVNDETKPIEDNLQKATYVLTPKMFFSKSYERTIKSTKLSENKEQNDIPAVKKSRCTITEKDKNKLVDKDDIPVALPFKSYSKTKQCNTKRKNIENKSTTLNVSQKQRNMSTTRGKSKDQMKTEQILKELTRKDKSPVKCNLLPVNKKDVVDQVNLNKSVKSISGKRLKTANNVRNKQKSRLSLADIVKEIFPESPEKKNTDHKVISDISNITVASQKHSEKDLRKKVSNDANKISDEWDNSLLLITDDFNSSGNVYDFEEFQIDVKVPSAKKSSFRKCDKNKSMKKTAMMKAVFNGKKVNKKLASQKIIKKSNTKTTKIKHIKKIVEKKMSPVSGGNPAIGCEIFKCNQQSFINNCDLSVSGNQTPTDQMMKGLVSITELEKLKATKHTENKRVSKVNHGGVYIPETLAPGWPQLPDLPSKHPVKLKRAAMEGPTAADNLPENKPKSIMIKTSSAFNQSLLNMSSMDTESSASKPKLPKTHFKLSDKNPSADNQSIDLFTYPVDLPTKKQGNKVKKNDECKEKKETSKKLMDFMYPGSVVRFLDKPKEDTHLISPPPVMLPKFLHIQASTPKIMDNSSTFQKLLAGESMCISPVKDFQSSVRTYEHKSRRNSSAFLSIIKNVEVFKDEPKENSLQEKKTEKVKAKKKDGYFKKNKNFYEWASKLSNEFDEIEQFELSIEG